MSKVTTSETINKLIFDNNIYSHPLSVPFAFCIHISVIQKWGKVMNSLFKNDEWEMNEQILQIGTKYFNMRLIIVRVLTSNYQLNFLTDSIKNSQFSFPWDNNPTLFTEVGSFEILEEFIKEHKLEAYILKIEEMVGISANSEIIKFVSFSQSVNTKLDVILEFRKLNHKPKYYFMMVAFPWQQPNWHSGLPINENVYSVLPIVLRHLGTLSYTRPLNIMDLISLRWALGDVLSELPQSNLVKYEIDFMIKFELAKIVKNNHLNLQQYLIVKNCKYLAFLLYYLVYEYQNFFDTLTIDDPIIRHSINSSIGPAGTILLVYESDIFSKLRDRYNVLYHIDGTGFDQMSLSLFLNLLECDNVTKITLDTNYRCLRNISKLNRLATVNKCNVYISVHLMGGNTYNFIEHFVTELKPITFKYKTPRLFIGCKLDDFRIFENLKGFNITFEKFKIDAKMLAHLQQCNIEPLISMYNCFFESNCSNWELLNNSRKLDEVIIYEDEGTWQTMFDFVLGEMLKLKTNEFQFNSHINIQIGTSIIWLNDIKFTIDEENSKLEIRDEDDNILDLYYEIFRIEPGEKSDYEFYE